MVACDANRNAVMPQHFRRQRPVDRNRTALLVAASPKSGYGSLVAVIEGVISYAWAMLQLLGAPRVILKTGLRARLCALYGQSVRARGLSVCRFLVGGGKVGHVASLMVDLRLQVRPAAALEQQDPSRTDSV